MSQCPVESTSGEQSHSAAALRIRWKRGEYLAGSSTCHFAHWKVEVADAYFFGNTSTTRTTSFSTNTSSQRRSSVFKGGEAVIAASLDRTAQRAEDKRQIHNHRLFAWLNWAPQPNTPCFRRLHKSFPGAIPGPAIHARVSSFFDKAIWVHACEHFVWHEYLSR